MADVSPATPTPASTAVQEAYDRFYVDLVAELTALCGSAGAAEAAVDEAFRQAAAMPDFAEIGRARDWLRVTARNQVVRRAFRRDDLDGTAGIAGTPAAARFERPSLAASLSRARRAHHADLVRRASLGAAGAVIAVTAVFAATTISPWATPSAQPASGGTPSTTRSSPPLIPPPTPRQPRPRPWSHGRRRRHRR